MSKEMLPEVIDFKKDRSQTALYKKEGIYIVHWPGGVKTVSKPTQWFHTLFWLKPETEEVEVEEKTKSFYYNGSTEIFTYPELVELRWASDEHTEIFKAIERYHLREKFGLPHPFDLPEEEEEFGENTVKTSEYR